MTVPRSSRNTPFAMRVHFLGGADEVGASSLLVEAGGKRILIDAGIRMGKVQGDMLPDLSRATSLGGLCR